MRGAGCLALPAGGGIVVDWGRVLAASGVASRGLSDAATISNWLSRSDEAALTGIVTQVSGSSAVELDRLDAALLSLATVHASPDVRLRLIKFYTIFKIAETQRFREFRGFPQ
jgi:hypothetical protein